MSGPCLNIFAILFAHLNLQSRGRWYFTEYSYKDLVLAQ